MRKAWTVAVREYRAAVRTKSFLVSLVLMPLLMAGSAVIQMIAKRMDDTGEKRFAVIDRTPGEQLLPLLVVAAAKRNTTDLHDPETGRRDKPAFRIDRIKPSAATPEEMNAQRYELSQRVHQGEYYGFLEIGADVCHPSSALPDSAAVTAPRRTSDHVVLRYQSNNPTYGAFFRWAEKVLNAGIHAKRCVEAGVSPELLTGVLQPVPVLSKGLTRRNPQTGVIEDPPTENPIAHYLVPAGLLALMFLLIMVGATPLMQGVVEEKMQRIAEVLLGSIEPFPLMAGKLLGMVGVSFTIMAVYLGGAFTAAYSYGYTDYLSPGLVAWFIVFQALAVVMYGSIFIAIGAACTDMRETQTMLMPVMMLACLPLFFLGPVIERPNSAFALGISLFPTATPMLMITRQAVPPGIAWWQPVLGVLGVLAAAAVCVWAAGRIFRVGILLQGRGARFGDLVRWVLEG